jgi:hypothetical protein
MHHRRAAVELLISHGSWLERDDFVDDFVTIVLGLIDGTPMAPIDWPKAINALDHGQLPCSGGEGRMLRLVASLAQGIPVDLRDALTGLDARSADLVARAVQQATGHQ